LQVLKNEVEVCLFMKQLSAETHVERCASQDIRTTFQTAQSGLETLLAERSSLREEKAILDLLIHLTETLERTENLLGIRRDEAVDEEDELGDEVTDMRPETSSDRRGRGRGRSADKTTTSSGTAQTETLTRPKLSVRIASSTDDILAANGNLPKRDIKMLRRIANEYTQLIYLTNKAKREGCAYVTVGREGADVERVSHYPAERAWLNVIGHSEWRPSKRRYTRTWPPPSPRSSRPCPKHPIARHNRILGRAEKSKEISRPG
jgi:hypothetical protein